MPKQIELIKKNEFTIVVLDSNNQTFIVQIAYFTSFNIYPFHRFQIAFLIQDEAYTVVTTEYIDFIDLFSPELATKLLKHTGINNCLINLLKA